MSETINRDHPLLADLADPDLLRAQAFLGGDWVGAESGATQAVTDPANGAELGRVASLSADDARRAAKAAQDAWPGWAGLLPQERTTILRRWFELMTRHREDLAKIMTAEQGKPIRKSACPVRRS